jgi:hypothetical protein
VALIWLLWVGTSEWSVEQATFALRALLVWMLFSKFIKLVTHFVRYPVDILLWPVSILFGWFHGIIKVYAMVTLNEVRAPFHSTYLLTDRSPTIETLVQDLLDPLWLSRFLDTSLC